MSTTAVKLRDALAGMTEKLALIVREVKVKPTNRGGMVVVVAPEYYWDTPTADQAAGLISIKRDYEEWIELLQVSFRNAQSDVVRQIKNADRCFRVWLEFAPNWSLTPRAHENEVKFRADVSNFNPLLDILDSAAGVGFIIIPDTNSIIEHPNPADYRGIAERASFTLLFLPTVLAELDELKNLHRNPEFRDKVKQVITRIKGWRKQGSLRDGVKVDTTITVRALSNEPDMSKSLSWLDPGIDDDRIIASVLDVQANNPSDRVVLVTGDINLLNKAAAVRISHAEI